uniref:Golgi apparatus membrane protein tvp18 n=1 Tax=Neosartorya fischeri (strain ATCC 1020 / DSM 3700 / CBS 544.65 / FGSC A1164 / JCM 1740 / NRRL 181 / WB 181) TaxID=331117 RepID=TVP18_NEOFI|nr:RecName: Full=Golgi apparatus membrane protein tvp18 [Aspergillus fischeri NRRL 181]
MTLAEEFRSRNFSIYGQWTGVLCIILCIALGIANIFSFAVLRIIFSVLCLYAMSGLILIFIEVPFLLRICPTSSKFDAFIRRFTTNWMRAAMYAIMSVVQWLSLLPGSGASSLIVAAVFLLIASIFYALAGLKSQEFVGSKTLGGQGLVQMIV